MNNWLVLNSGLIPLKPDISARNAAWEGDKREVVILVPCCSRELNGASAINPDRFGACYKPCLSHTVPATQLASEEKKGEEEKKAIYLLNIFR